METNQNWLEEKQSAYFYAIMASTERHPLRKNLFKQLAQAAEEQAVIWEKKLSTTDNHFSQTFHPSIRARFIGLLLKNVGPERLRPILSAMKVRGLAVFNGKHQEHRHLGFNTASNLRAAVFGINDGLISNVSLLLGLSGAEVSHSMVVLAGIAGLLAGACSMAAGEYISMRSQREVFEYQIALEKKELELYPEEEQQELAMIYQARGIPEADAQKLSELMISNPDTGLDTLAREELGLNPDDLGSPIGAMIASFVAFSIGASIPLLPFLSGDNSWNIYFSIAFTAFALAATGTVLSIFTNTNPVINGLRMLLIGAVAGGMTYLIGSLLGVNVG